MHRSIWSYSISVLTAVIAIGCSGCGDDPVQPGPPPSITQFSAVPADIMPGDSSLITYQVSNSNRSTLTPDGSNLPSAGSGDLYVKPSVPTIYVLRAINDEGEDSDSLTITMNGAVPRIDSFTISPDTILTGESILLGWETVRTDSLVIDHGVGRVAAPDSGDVMASPTADLIYRAIAYNGIGRDTASVSVRVEVPLLVEGLFGSHFKGDMGSGIVSPEFVFRILDAQARSLRKPWLHFSVVEGDGSLVADSAQPNASGLIYNDYTFSGANGALGYGVVQALVRDVDTIVVDVRASVLRFGAGHQGQYIRAGDTYGEAVALIGPPASIDPDPRTEYLINYANYETELGVVLALFDENDDNIAQESELVFEVFVNTAFDKISPEGIGINTPISTVRAQFGATDETEYFKPGDAQNAPTWVLPYTSRGASIFCDLTPPDSVVVEIHIGEPAVPGPAAVSTRGISTRSESVDRPQSKYRRYTPNYEL